MRGALVRARRALTAALLCAGASLALAHQSSDAYLRVGTGPEGKLALQIDVALRDLEVVLDLDRNADGQLSWGEVRQREADIADHVAAHLRMDDGRCSLRAQPGMSLDRKADGVYAVLRYTSDCAVASSPSLTYGLFRETDPTHRGLLTQVDAQARPVGALRSLPPGGAPVRLVFDAASASGVSAAAATEADTAGELSFFGDGLHHILIGVDHVLFLVVLLLPLVLAAQNKAWRATAWPLLALVTAFTVGHSITLGLASLRILAVPPSVIEPLIALTIALTALDNLRPFMRGRRALAAFVFGLIHGFGFAGPLVELDLAPATMAWALLKFNLGVEAGQLAVVLVATILLWPLRGRSIARQVLVAGSVAAGLLALVWFGERVFGFKVLPF